MHDVIGVFYLISKLHLHLEASASVLQLEDLLLFSSAGAGAEARPCPFGILRAGVGLHQRPSQGQKKAPQALRGRRGALSCPAGPEIRTQPLRLTLPYSRNPLR